MSATRTTAATSPIESNGHDRRCRNCGAVAVQKFCPECGQTTTLHPPTVGEFLHEFLGHHVAIDGSLWRTLKALSLIPGRLTVEYFAGRRARYIGPLRLYLTFSLILFAVAGFSGGNLHLGNEMVEFKLPSELAKDKASNRVVIGPRIEEGARTGYGWLDRSLDRMEAMTAEQRSARINAGMRQFLPYVLIVLVPVLALVLKIAYWNRHRWYGEHLVVAFHAQTVVFILALISETPVRALIGSFIWIVLFVHGFVALRRVYGGRWFPTLVREVLIFMTYGIAVTMGLAVTATLALAL